MYLHGSAQRNIHKTAIENGWRVHAHNGSDSNPLASVHLIEYRRGTSDHLRVAYRGHGRTVDWATTPKGYRYGVRQVQEYLARPFKGRNLAETPAAPTKPHRVVVWREVHAFADAADARAFEEKHAADGDLVTVFAWRQGAFMQTRKHNGS